MAEISLGKDAQAGEEPKRTSTPNIFFVYNPVAGADDAGAGRAQLEQRFKDAQWRYTIYETTGKESLPEIVRKAVPEGYDMVVAGGGDGTVAMVAAGLVGTKIPLGIIPMGSGNVLSNELVIPQNTTGAVDLIIGEHAIREIDAMQVDDNYFFLTASVGVSTDIIQETNREQKRRLGVLAYMYNAASKLGGFRLHNFTLTIDGRRYNGWASEVLIANCGIIGLKGLRTELGIKPDDGKVEVCIVRSRTLLDLMNLVWNVFIKRTKGRPEMHCVRASQSVYIDTTYPINFEADGEIVHPTPIELKVVHNAIRVVVPEVIDRPMQEAPVRIDEGTTPK